MTANHNGALLPLLVNIAKVGYSVVCQLLFTECFHEFSLSFSNN